MEPGEADAITHAIRSLRILEAPVRQLLGVVRGHCYWLREQGQGEPAAELARVADEVEVVLDGMVTVRRALGMLAYGDAEDTVPGIRLDD